jgi:hypothetical protein
MVGFKKIYSVFGRKPTSEFDPGWTCGSRQALTPKRASEAPRCFNPNRLDLMRLFQPLGIEAEFLGHLDQLLRGFWILDGFGELPGSVGLIAVVVGLGHRSTFLDRYGLRQKGSTSGTRPDMAG